ncbi:putative transporter [Lachnellula subtilissima]|uniref:Putative transporter n=1 Tax=Lachnellula subtilissima TaxID=602034 RepID=A0A8H8RKI3_9HELO|nr:putative transporter [Lachnellula subtilissima]
MHAKRQRSAWYHWYAESDSPEERRLIRKLDLLIVPYAFLGYWIKFIDQTNITNAYVSGLSEELGFHGNQLVQLGVVYTVGSVVGQLPCAYLFPRFPMHYLIPSFEIGWGIFTLLQYRAQGYSELMAYRFIIGLFEAVYFPGVHYVLGSWYRGDEIGRRGGLFYVGLTLGTLTAGLIQSGTSANLEGVDGLSGWRWMFIITALMTIPVGIAGVFLWPGTPDKPNRWFLTPAEVELSRTRLSKGISKGASGVHLTTRQRLRYIFTDWKIYTLVLWGIIYWNINATSYGGYLLWLKSLKRYSKAQLNQYGSTSPAVGIFYVLFINFGSDLFLGRTGAITLSCTINIISLIILTIWNVPEAAKWVAFNLQYAQFGMSSVFYGWVNDILRNDPKERALTLVLVNAISQSTTAWIPLFTFPTIEGPKFRKGYSYALAMSVVLILYTALVIKPLHRRQE